MNKQQILVWIYGLLGACFNGGINSIGVLFIAPESFNFSNSGLKKLGELFAVGAIVGAYLYCKQSPISLTKLAEIPVNEEKKEDKEIRDGAKKENAA